MGAFLIILIVVWLLFIIFRPAITRWTQQFMARRAEDMMRRMMGMPSRKEEQRRKRQASRGSESQADGRQPRGGAGRSSRRYHRSPRYDAADLMRSVAEDVEYTEIREFESTTIVDESDGNTRVIDEEQVADVEYTEIRGSR